MKGDGAAERKAVIIRSTLEAVYVAAHFLAPFIPDATDAIFQKLGRGPYTHQSTLLRPYISTSAVARTPPVQHLNTLEGARFSVYMLTTVLTLLS